MTTARVGFKAHLTAITTIQGAGHQIHRS